jgi:hypothetical protein
MFFLFGSKIRFAAQGKMEIAGQSPDTPIFVA